MSDTRSQLEEVDALIAASPDDPSLQQLREDLLQLIALEEQEQSAATEQHVQPLSETGGADTQLGGDVAQPDIAPAAASATAAASEQYGETYTAQGTFMEHSVSTKESIAEAPDIGTFQLVSSSSTKSPAKQASLKSDDANGEAKGNLKDDTLGSGNATTTEQQQPEKKKKKKKKKSDDAMLEAKFELPSHLVPLESDTPAQKLKKQRTAKALKSKFREKQKEAEHAKRQNDWKSFATKGGKRKKAGNSIFSTEEGVNARVGVISGGGGRKMTDFADQSKRHKFS